ncbi:MAG: hypothetical protein NTW86_32000 [Candidatus Sumerlaeota bacterium]|nr:hypothetical protein [Candidatus Sumerlaeota bacterium]
MKRINHLWDDPVGWSERAAKSGLRVFATAFLHLAGVLVALFMIGFFVHLETKRGDTNTLGLILALGGLPIIFIGVALPAQYLYAMHRLLGMLKEREGRSQRH